MSRHCKLRTTFSCTHRSAICFFPYLIELMQKSVLSLGIFLSLDCLPFSMIDLNTAFRSSCWNISDGWLHRTILAPPFLGTDSEIQNLNCSIQEQAALWELLKETLSGKPMKVSKNANGPPKRSYHPEGWREAYSLFFYHATKILLERKNLHSSQYGHHWHADYLLQFSCLFFTEILHTHTLGLFWICKHKTHRGSILGIHANVSTDNPLEACLHFYLILFDQSLNLISSICKKKNKNKILS